jgi:hypothetical protein
VYAELTLNLDDPAERRRRLDDGEAALAAGSLSHNHLHFRRDAMDACLRMRDWNAVLRHAAALEDYVRAEPLPWAEFFIAHGRVLAACGRGDREPATLAALRGLRETAERAGFRMCLPSLAAAADRVEKAPGG